jgi:hypothetical protein
MWVEAQKSDRERHYYLCGPIHERVIVRLPNSSSSVDGKLSAGDNTTSHPAEHERTVCGQMPFWN